MGLKKSKSKTILYLIPIGFLFIIIPILVGLKHHHKHYHYLNYIASDQDYTILKYTKLPDLLNETSGLIYFNNLIWTFNDSGGEPELYAWSEKDSCIKKRVSLWKAYNFDWEDISQDSSFIYVGDIGNNFGNRGNLCIYRVEKKNLYKKGNQAVKSDRISFTYPDYLPISVFKFKKSSFDCEALICYKDSLILFTKDWNKNTSTIYSLPKKPGSYIAHKICEFQSNGLVTAADYNGEQLVLLGYKDYRPFIWLFHSPTNLNLNQQSKKRYDLIDLSGAQTEGIAYKDSKTFYISNEKSAFEQSLWLLQIK
jgi:hypothetical protein